MSDGTHRRGGRIAVAGGVVLALAAACSDVPTDPTEPFSLTASLPFPSVVVDSVMRNLAGEPAPVQVTVYNGAGEVIPDAPVTFRLIDTVPGVTVDATGRITGRRLADGTLAQGVRLVVDAGGLQSAPLRIDVVERPDTLHVPVTETGPLEWSAVPTAPNRSEALEAFVWHLPGAGADSIPVPSWVVRYALSYDGSPATSDSTPLFWFSDEGGSRHTPLDTTATDGRVVRRLRAKFGPGLEAVETVVVVITAEGSGTLLAKPDTIRIPVRRAP